MLAASIDDYAHDYTHDYGHWRRHPTRQRSDAESGLGGAGLWAAWVKGTLWCLSFLNSKVNCITPPVMRNDKMFFVSLRTFFYL